jgi:hypothetical protein
MLWDLPPALLIRLASDLPALPPQPCAVLQLALSPLLLAGSFLAGVLSSALYAVGTSYYFYITFLGYSALPFLERTEVGCFQKSYYYMTFLGYSALRFLEHIG